MKILHFHFGKYGGAEAFFCHLVGGLARVGVEQKAVIRPQRRWRSEIADVAEIVAETHFRTASLDRLSVPLRVRRVIDRWQPDAILAWMSRAGHLLPASTTALRCARLGDYPDRLTQFKHADLLICNTPGIVQRARELGWTRRAEVVTNFTHTAQVAPADRNTFNTPRQAPLICSVGRLVPRKGFDVLVRALTKLPEAYLWIIGEGPEEENLRKLADELGVAARTRFLGWRDDPRPYLAAGDIAAMASSHEPLGNVVLEAWAQRRPIVAAASEGPSWLIEHEDNGLLVDIGDHEGFARAFDRLLSDRALCDRVVAGGAAALDGKFSEASVIESYLNVLSGGSSLIHAA